MPVHFPVVIHHNPACGTSRAVVAMAETAGHQPVIVEYLKTGWTKPQLQALFAAAGITAQEALRTAGTQAEALGLIGPGVSEDALLDAMVADPVLVNRPIVATPKGVRLCRPSESAAALF